MAGFNTQHTTANDPAFRAAVQVAMSKVALQVQGEAQDTRPFIEWEKRAALAQNVLGTTFDAAGNAQAGVDVWIGSFSYAVAQNPTIGDVTTWPDATRDSDIEFQITSIWSDMAGVTGRDLAQV